MSDSTDKTLDICGLGMSMVDLIQVVEEFPNGGGVTETLKSTLMGGGPVPTALCTAGRLGAKVAIIDRIGDDWRGQQVRQEYTNFRVDTENLILEANKSTTLGSVLVRQRDGERHVVFSPGDFTPLATEELPLSLLDSAKILHLNGRHWPACIAAAQRVRQSGGQVSFDGGAGRYDVKFQSLLPHVDILIVARDFAEKFSASENTGDQLAALIGTGASIVAITDGQNGSWFANIESEVFHQPAFQVQSVVDTTGCGDAFHGGFLYAHSYGWSMREAACFASAVAALNATSLGGRGNLPELSEVRELISRG